MARPQKGHVNESHRFRVRIFVVLRTRSLLCTLHTHAHAARSIVALAQRRQHSHQ
jgi:hypothetical protein